MTPRSTSIPSNGTLNSSSDETILAELSRILASSQFMGTSRSKRFLEYIVKETLSGRGDDLKGYTIALDVFDKSTNFDSNQNTVVRVQATQVRRRLKLYYADQTDHSGVHISLPKGRYKPTFLTHSSAPAVNKLSTRETQSAFDYPILEIRPLKNHSEEQSHQSFTDSVTTELIHKLSELNVFQIILGSDDLENTDHIEETHDNSDNKNTAPYVDLKQKGFALSGVIRRMDLKVRVTVLLCSLADATYIKTHAFDESFTKETIFDAPETLADQIVKFLDP